MKVRERHWFVTLLLTIFFMAGCSGGGGGGGTTPISDAKAITAFSFTSPAATGTITESAKTIAVTVPNGTNVTGLAATFTTTGANVKVGAIVQVSGTTVNDFTNPATYTVAAADGSTTAYTVTVTVASSSAKAITAFLFTSPAATGTIAESAKTIAVTVPNGTNVTALTATFTTTGASVKVGATVQVSGITANNFTSPVTYTVTAADSTTATYTVTVTVAASSAKGITAFSFTSPAAMGIIDENAKTIAVYVPKGTNVTALVATFTTTGVSVEVGSTDQVSGTTANNFTNPVTYTVTAADSTTVTYTVTVTIATGAIMLPKTGLTTCYGYVGVVACANTGQDGELQKGVAWPNPRFTANVDTSVTDNLTGLAWAPNGNLMPTRDSGWDHDYMPNDGQVKWQHALDYVAKLNAENYLGHNDWRLPNLNELKSLVIYAQSNTATWLNTQGFTNAQAVRYWSSTSCASEAFTAWSVNMSGGIFLTEYSAKTASYYVWPVRAGQSAGAPAELPKTGQTICYDIAGAVITCTNTGQDGELQKGVAWPNPRFTANVDTSVTDNLTGLAWASNGNVMPTRDSGWDTGDMVNEGAVYWQYALDYVAKLNAEKYLGHNDWRLPDVNELESLVNAGQSDATTWLNTQGFTNAQSGYWSSTPYPVYTGYAWGVSVSGGVGNGAIFGSSYVWPVRAGQ